MNLEKRSREGVFDEKDRGIQEEIDSKLVQLNSDIVKKRLELGRKKGEKLSAFMNGHFFPFFKLIGIDEIKKMVREKYFTRKERANTWSDMCRIFSEATSLDQSLMKNIILVAREMREAEKDYIYPNYEEIINPIFELVDSLVEEDRKQLMNLLDEGLQGEHVPEIFEILERNPGFNDLVADIDVHGANLTAFMRQSPEGSMTKTRAGMGLYPGVPILVYYNAKRKIAFTDKEWIERISKGEMSNFKAEMSNFKAEEATDFTPAVAFISKSRRAFFIVKENGGIIEFKGWTPITLKGLPVVEASGDLEGVLCREYGENEEYILNRLGQIKAQLNIIGDGESDAGETIEYVQLVREEVAGKPYNSFLRFDDKKPVIKAMTDKNGITFEDCNMDNCIIPPSCSLINCSNRMIRPNNGVDWSCNNQGVFVEVLNG